MVMTLDETATEVRGAKENADLILLSDHPVSRWANLLSMDVIRQRNKPREPPNKPQAAPFFLPTIQGLEFKFDLDKGNDAEVRDSHNKASIYSHYKSTRGVM